MYPMPRFPFTQEPKPIVLLSYSRWEDRKSTAPPIFISDVHGADQTLVAPGATLYSMASDSEKPKRVFKTAWFTKTARKAHIPDEELCFAIRQVMLGHADDLGGGVFKKRLRNNQYRSIILARAGHYWAYEYLFA